MKRKSSKAANEYVVKGYDACQTPPETLDPLLPYLNKKHVIWECAAGERNLATTLINKGFTVTESDLLSGQNFFEFKPDNWNCIVTNPPYSLKYKWLKRCYELGKPFALLVPVEMLGAATAQKLMKQYSFEIMLLNHRVNFKMPNKGWAGTAQFPVMWLCWRLLPTPVVFGEFTPIKRSLSLANAVGESPNSVDGHFIY